MINHLRPIFAQLVMNVLLVTLSSSPALGFVKSDLKTADDEVALSSF